MLQWRNVLIFVDGEPCDIGADGRGHVIIAFHQMAYDQQNIVEIDFVAVGFFRFIRFVYVYELAWFEA